eukprot:3698322-Pleurochrysis_carterae.AAC.1
MAAKASSASLTSALVVTSLVMSLEGGDSNEGCVRGGGGISGGSFDLIGVELSSSSRSAMLKSKGEHESLPDEKGGVPDNGD